MKYIFFTSQHCAPCKALKPKILKHKEIRIIDVDSDGKLTVKYGVMSIPMLLILNSDDSVEKQISGSRIGKWLDETFKK